MKNHIDWPTAADVPDSEIVVENENRRETPPVTVSITLYNYEEYILPCLESVRTQTLGSLDLVVIDDCSTDGSVEIVSDWLSENGSRFNNYQLARHPVNSGLAGARNSGFHHARTEFVFILDADNTLYPRCLERLLAALRHCNASFAYCYLEKFGQKSLLQNTNAWNPDALQHGNVIDAMVLLRRSVWEEVGGYSKMEVMGWEDFDFWFKIARRKGWGVLVPEILARYRVHRKSMLKKVTNPKVRKLWTQLRATYPEFFTGGLKPNW